MSKPTEAIEDYAKAIYALSREHQGPILNGEVAERLGVTPATATSMLKRLGELGLVDYLPYRGVNLTAAGDVGGEVAGVDVGDRGDEGGAEERPDPAPPATVAVQRAPRRGRDRRLAREDVLDRRLDPPVLKGCLDHRRRLQRPAPSSRGSRRSGPGIGVP